MFSSESWLSNQQAGFYNGVATQSLRFDDGSSAYLSRTFSTPTNNKIWTFSTWVKRGNLGINYPTMFSRAIDASNYFQLRFDLTSELITVFDKNAGANSILLQTTPKYRDTSSWYHILVAYDTTQATSSDRVKLYVNGEQVIDFNTATYPAQNYAPKVNTAGEHKIGTYSTSQHFDGYLSEVNFVDGSQLTPTSFGETKNGVWIPIEYTGSYGTNGFRLQFNQTGTGTASASTIGADTSGNNNHWTSSGIVASDCNMPDSPENNFATLNALDSWSATLSEGNLEHTVSSAVYSLSRSTISYLTGSWYVEIRSGTGNTNNGQFAVGLSSTSEALSGITGTGSSYIGGSANSYAFWSNGALYNNNSYSILSTTYTANDIIAIAFDGTTIKYYKNNVHVSDANQTVGSGHEYVLSVTTHSDDSCIVNFGQDSSFAGNKTAQGNSDANGIGDFYYAPPSGFLALCTSNLPEPTISPNATTQADDYFNTVLYTGNGSTQSITGVGFQPDWLWIKSRSTTDSHGIFDSNRGSTKRLFANALDKESTQSAGVTSFDSDGFSLGSNLGQNRSSATLVAWNWKANGGTTSSNSDGSITSTVQANTTAGFSIVQYVATGSNATVGHGLGVEPDTVWVKNRDTDSRHWMSYWRPLGGTDRMIFNTGATASTSTSFNNTSPTSTVFSIGTSAHVNDTSDNYIAYCFASVEGYSKIGSYTGNGNADGTFVYTGFRPAFIIYKKTSGTGNWGMLDNTRSTSNLTQAWVASNLANAETNESTRALDFLSNGFKARGTNADLNTNSATYIYMAFAENPFKYANAR